MSGASGAVRPRVFYGWWLVGVSLLFQSVGTGTTVYLYSVVAGALETEYPSGRFLLMMGATLFFLTGGLMSPRIGRLIDRYPLKHILAAGGVTMGAGFFIIAASTSIWQVLFSYAVFIAVGFATLSGLASATLLSRWFMKHRGLAIGTAALGTQFGGLVFPPVVAHLMEIYDWRIAMAVLGLFTMVAIPALVYLTVRDYPGDMGMGKDGGPPHWDDMPRDRTPGSAVPGLSLIHLLRQRNFILVTLGMGLISAVNTSLIANLALFAIDVGENRERGAYLVSVLSFMGILFSPLVGRWCDVWNIKRVALAMCCLSAGAGLIYFVSGDYRLLLVATLVQGIAGGSIMPLWAGLVARICDVRAYGQVFGGTTVFVFAMTAVAPSGAGWLYDLTESYRMFFLLMTLAMLLAAFFVAMLKWPEDDAGRIGAMSEPA